MNRSPYRDVAGTVPLDRRIDYLNSSDETSSLTVMENNQQAALVVDEDTGSEEILARRIKVNTSREQCKEIANNNPREGHNEERHKINLENNVDSLESDQSDTKEVKNAGVDSVDGFKEDSSENFEGSFTECEKVDDISSASNYDGDETASLLKEEEKETNDQETYSKFDSCAGLDESEVFHQRKHGFNIHDRRFSLNCMDGEGFMKRMMDRNSKTSEEIPLNDRDLTEAQTNTVQVKKVVSNGQVLSTSPPKMEALEKHRNKSCCSCCGPKTKFCLGILCLLIGVLTVIWTPYELLMNERLRMTPGLPAFDWWERPPNDVLLLIRIFNITNARKFMAGTDDKLEMEEYGPIIYKEMLEHTNITFNKNGTMTYTARRWVEFVPEYNKHIDLNATLTVPNIPVLGFASYLNEKGSFAKTPFNFFLWSSRSNEMFLQMTAYDFLWNLTSPVLKAARTWLPGIVPVSNIGMLQTMYMDFTDQVTVYIGTKWGDSMFFSLDNFHGRPELPGYQDTCKETVRGSTEGLIYTQRLKKNSTLHYWRKTLCKVVSLEYVDEVQVGPVTAYRFVLPKNTYHRTHNESNPDCFAGRPNLPNGLSDISKCFFNFPMALSLPHFQGTDPSVIKHISGLSPDPKKHGSYAIVEPTTGIPLESHARSQSNLVVRNLTGYGHNIQRFSGITIPIFWAEYCQLGLPNYVWALIIMQVRIVPVCQVIFSFVMILIGVVAIFKRLKVYCFPSSFSRHRELKNLARNTILGYENEKKMNTLMKR